jgi:hypothetical protein
MLPPGSGKTLIGAELARRLGRRIVGLTPNTAIQGQWTQLWHLLGTDAVTVAENRDLDADVTMLTYQAISKFSDPDPTDQDGVPPADTGSDRPNHTARLHPDAADFLTRLAAGRLLTGLRRGSTRSLVV